MAVTPPPATLLTLILLLPSPGFKTARRRLLRHASRLDRRDGRIQRSLARDAQRHVEILLRAVLGDPHHHRQAQRAVIAELQIIAGLHREHIAFGGVHLPRHLLAHRWLDDLAQIERAGGLVLGADGVQFEGVGLISRLEHARGQAAIARPGDFLELVLAAAVAVRPKSCLLYTSDAADEEDSVD